MIAARIHAMACTARVMSDLPRWHTQPVRPLPRLPLPLRPGTRALPLTSREYASVRGQTERHRAQSCARHRASGHPPWNVL